MTNMNTKPRPKAVALTYQPTKSEAPIVTAKGQGKVAENIVEIAKQHGIPIKEDTSLVEVLSQLDLEQQIPVELYQLVAEILSSVYEADQLVAARKGDL